MPESAPCLQTLRRRRARATPSRSAPAVREDVASIVRLIHGLAEFEKLTHLVAGHARVARAASVRRPAGRRGAVAERAGRVVAFALFFTNFSTFLAQPGPLSRGPVRRARRSAASGIGQALLEHLARLAATRGCGRFEWSVLDWNEGAIRFYQRMGATVMPDWRICRIAGAGARPRSGLIRRVAERRRSLRRAARRLSLARAGATSTSPRSAARAGRASGPTRSRSASRREDGARTDFTYRELDREADRLAAALRRLGVGRGDRVALVLPQRFETAVAHIALYRLGAVAMPLSMLFGPDALEYRINDSEARLAIVDESGIANVRRGAAALPEAARP